MADAATTQLLQLQIQDYEERLIAHPRYAAPGNLARFGHQVFSQHAEDGIIAEIFRRIETTSKTFVECGVGDGLENNTAFLLTQGWTGAWVDAAEKQVAAIRQRLGRRIADGTLALARALVTAENVEQVFRAAGVKPGVDLLSLDVDRNTYWIWRALAWLQPRVAVVEYNAVWPADVDWVIEYKADRGWNGSMHFGASLLAYERLGAELGYALVGCSLNGVNAFFVRRDLCGDHFDAPFTAAHHYEPARYFLNRRIGHPRSFGDEP